jgi:hypothetical protein
MNAENDQRTGLIKTNQAQAEFHFPPYLRVWRRKFSTFPQKQVWAGTLDLHSSVKSWVTDSKRFTITDIH